MAQINNINNISANTALIKEAAAALGFSFCGIAEAKRLDDDAERLENWLSKGLHGTMKYMENHFEMRVDPTRLVPGARSVITLMMNYFPSQTQQINTPHIAKYAYGMDYHEVIRGKLKSLLNTINEKIGEVHGRGFVDSAPVLERSWAQRSGLGWIGKNGNLLNPKNGSFFFLATLITDLPLQFDDPFAADFCGSCTRCIDACPTNAILPNKVVNGSACISYFTIELKEMLVPNEMQGKFANWAFGCDTCQDVCPWNRFSKPNSEVSFTPIPEVLNLSTKEWQEMSEEAFRKIFKHSAISRAKWSGMQRNLRMLQSSTNEKSP